MRTTAVYAVSSINIKCWWWIKDQVVNGENKPNVVQDPGPYREKPAKEEVEEPAPKPDSARASTLASGYYYGQQ